MHHVKNDKRSQTSAKLIYNALSKLLKMKPYETISVSLLCEQANVSRATFYRNFDIIEDVLTWYAQRMMRHIFAEYYENEHLQNTTHFNRFAMKCGLREADYIEMLTKANKLHILQDMLYSLLENIPLNVDQSIPNPYLKYALASKIGAFFGVIHCWIVSGKKEPLQELLDRLDEIDYLSKDLSIDHSFLRSKHPKK